jgi:hypothetical protein
MFLKSFFTVLIAATLSFSAKADQLAVLTLDQAISATEYLQTQEAVILWCACCEGDQMSAVMISEVYYQEWGVDENGEMLYTVHINGIDQNGVEVVGLELDLAYVHVVLENMAYCLGIQLGMPCDPCVEPFSLE